MTHALDTTVVEIDVRDFYLRRQSVSQYRKPVIVRSDLDSTFLQILHRLVTAAMSKDELDGLATKGAAEQLMPKTNPKHRFA